MIPLTCTCGRFVTINIDLYFQELFEITKSPTLSLQEQADLKKDLFFKYSIESCCIRTRMGFLYDFDEYH